MLSWTDLSGFSVQFIILHPGKQTFQTVPEFTFKQAYPWFHVFILFYELSLSKDVTFTNGIYSIRIDTYLLLKIRKQGGK